jgi:hypothetical protein
MGRYEESPGFIRGEEVKARERDRLTDDERRALEELADESDRAVAGVAARRTARDALMDALRNPSVQLVAALGTALAAGVAAGVGSVTMFRDGIVAEAVTQAHDDTMAEVGPVSESLSDTETVTAGVAAGLADVTERVETVEASVAALAAASNDLNTVVDAARGDLDALTALVEGHEARDLAERADAEARVAALEDLLDSARADLDRAVADGTATAESVAGERARIDQLAAGLAELEDRPLITVRWADGTTTVVDPDDCLDGVDGVDPGGNQGQGQGGRPDGGMIECGTVGDDR